MVSRKIALSPSRPVGRGGEHNSLSGKRRPMKAAQIGGVPTTFPSPPSSRLPSPLPAAPKADGWVAAATTVFGVFRHSSHLNHIPALVHHLSSIIWYFTAAPLPGPEVAHGDAGRLTQDAPMPFVGFLRLFWTADIMPGMTP